MTRTKSSIFAVIAALTIAPAAFGAGGSAAPATTGSSGADRAEAATVALQGLVEAQGGLGVYKDKAGWVVARPPSGAADLTDGKLSTLGIKVRVDLKATEKTTIDQLSADLEALHGTVSDDFGFGYDPATGMMIVRSAAPMSEFAAVQKLYPGLIDYHAGAFERAASWSNDAQPHWGGAWVQGGGWACTSGFAIEDNSGRRYMLTAGHCFANGVTTNMGTAVRPSQGDPWPYYDAELIKGHSYAGYVYGTSTTGRKVKNGTNPGVGNQYCTTGRTTGFQCDWTVKRLNETICYSDQPYCFHGLAGMTRPSGVPVQHGDSGGPLWYKYSDGTAGVRGVISGFFWDVGTFSWYSWVTQYTPVANFWVMHAVTP